MRPKATEPSGEILSTKPSFETWAPSAPYSCNLGSEALPNPGKYHKQIECAEKAANLVYRDVIDKGLLEDDAEWVCSQMLSRFNARIQLNNESMMSRNAENDNHAFIQRLLSRANKGKATIENLMRIREFLDLKSIELGRVSAPSIGGREAFAENLLTISRKEIEHRSGIVEDAPSEHALEWQFVEDQNGGRAKRGIMTISNKLGFLQDGTVFAKRESFAVIIPREVSRTRLPTIEDFVTNKLSEDVLVEPLAVTVYCYNKASEERSKERTQSKKTHGTKAALAKKAIAEGLA